MGLIRQLLCSWLLVLVLLLACVAQCAAAYYMMRELGRMHFITQFFVGALCFLSGIFRLAIVTAQATHRRTKMATCEKCFLWLAFWGQFVALTLLMLDQMGLWEMLLREVLPSSLAPDSLDTLIAVNDFSVRVQTAVSAGCLLACGSVLVYSLCPARSHTSLDLTVLSGHWVFDPCSEQRPVLQPTLSDALEGSPVSFMRLDDNEDDQQTTVVELKAYRHLDVHGRQSTRSTWHGLPKFMTTGVQETETEFERMSFERTSQGPMITFQRKSGVGDVVTGCRTHGSGLPKSLWQQTYTKGQTTKQTDENARKIKQMEHVGLKPKPVGDDEQKIKVIEANGQRLDEMEDKGQTLEEREANNQRLDQMEDKKPRLGQTEDERQRMEQMEDKKQRLDQMKDKGHKLDQIEEKGHKLDQIEEKGQKLDQLEDKGQKLDQIEGRGQRQEQMEFTLYETVPIVMQSTVVRRWSVLDCAGADAAPELERLVSASPPPTSPPQAPSPIGSSPFSPETEEDFFSSSWTDTYSWGASPDVTTLQLGKTL